MNETSNLKPNTRSKSSFTKISSSFKEFFINKYWMVEDKIVSVSKHHVITAYRDYGGKGLCNSDLGSIQKWWSDSYCRCCTTVETLVPIRGWATELVWMWWGTEKSCYFYQDSNPQPVTLLTELFWLLLLLFKLNRDTHYLYDQEKCAFQAETHLLVETMAE